MEGRLRYWFKLEEAGPLEWKKHLRMCLESYGLAHETDLYWLVLSEKLQEAQESAFELLPDMPDFALYQFLLLKGFSRAELQMLEIHGTPCPVELEMHFLPDTPIKNGLSESQQKAVFLAVNPNQTKGYGHDGITSFHFSICGNHFRWEGRRIRWKTARNDTYFSLRHLKRLLTQTFSSTEQYQVQLIDEHLHFQIKDLRNGSIFRFPFAKEHFRHWNREDLKKEIDKYADKTSDLLKLCQYIRAHQSNAFTLYEQLEQQLKGHDFVRYKEMPLPFAQLLEEWPEVHKSPFSHSYYNLSGKSWTHTPDQILRISDHWNFHTHGRMHGETDKKIPKGHWALARYCSTNGHYKTLNVLPPDENRRLDFVRLNEWKSKLNRYMIR